MYKKKKSGAALRYEEMKTQVRALVDAQRKLMPRLGTRKLHYLIAPALQQAGIKCGRDTLFTILRQDGLLIKAKQRTYLQTTNSRHRFRKYPNVAKDMVLSAPEQLWVSDITYVRTTEGWMFLSLITDAFSRKVVGYHIADNMEAATVADALRMALNGRVNKKAKPVHHSDRGIQYCSNEYTALALDAGLFLSMTEHGDPYENALAERMNRTFKEEFGLGAVLPCRAIALPMCQEAVALYNGRRPHLSLKMLTPDQVHAGSTSAKHKTPVVTLAVLSEADAGPAGEQPARNKTASENGAGIGQRVTIPATKAIFVAMPEKNAHKQKIKIPAPKATGTS